MASSNDFAVTVRQRGIYNCIVTKCLLMNPETGATREAACLWDTGATHTCIPQSIASSLQLEARDSCRVSGISGEADCGNVRVRVKLCVHGGMLPVDAVITSKFENLVIIGMDVINRGEFHITWQGDQRIFSFRIPSSSVKDCVEEVLGSEGFHKPPTDTYFISDEDQRIFSTEGG